FNETASWTYPTIARHYNAVLKMIDEAGKADADVKVKYAATAASMNNVAKNYAGQLEGFKRIDAAGQKQAEEAAVLA
ncbi:S46 family peptidase, partial [Mycobacterium tuberculosis]|nr:S46 family peptidase [Mycobacterium tuberculosis]